MQRPFTRRRPFSRPHSAHERVAALPITALGNLSVFETLRAYGGALFKLEEHLKRFAGSCQGLARPVPLTAAETARWLKETLKESGMPDAVLRFSAHWDGGGGECLCIVRPFSGYPRSLYETGVALNTAVLRRAGLRAQDAQIKSSQYAAGVLAQLDPRPPGIHELLFLDERLTVAEGTVSNIFIVKEKRILTPPASSGILRGVTRTLVIDLVAALGLAVAETPLTRHELYTADEAFLTNTSSEVLPVTSIDTRRIGDGRPGPVSKKLLNAFRNEVKRSLKLVR